MTLTALGPGLLVSLLLARDVPVVLQVVDWESGTPLAGLALEVGASAVVTDASGRAEVRLSESAEAFDGSLALVVESPGWCTTVRRLDPSALGAPIAIPLWRGARILGAVEDAEGRPVAGASVTACLLPPEDLDPESLAGDGLTLDALDAASGVRRAAGRELPPRTTFRPPRAKATSDAQGRFELAGLPASEREYELRARAAGRVETRARTRLAAPAADAFVALRLPAGATVVGRLTRSGQPAAGRVRWGSDGRAGEEATDEDGAFELRGVPAGEVELRGFVPGRRTGSPPAILHLLDGQLATVALDVPPPLGTISGRVVDTTGAARAGLRVCAERGDVGWLCYAAPMSAITGADGSFSIEIGGGQGPYRLWVTSGMAYAGAADVALGQSGLELVLPRTGSLRLLAVEAATRLPVRRARLYWRPSGSSALELAGDLPLDATGACTLELPLGAHDLLAVPERSELAPAWLRNAAVLGEASDALELRFPPSTSLALGLLDEAGRPADPPCDLWLVEESCCREASGERAAFLAFSLEEERFRARSTGGVARFAGLAAGRYRVVGGEGALRFAPEVVEVPAASRVSVRWSPAEER